MSFTGQAPMYEALTIPLTKHLECGHERTDAMASKVGSLVHCNDCRGLADVVRISLPVRVRLTKISRERLQAAGYTSLEVQALEAEQEARR